MESWTWNRLPSPLESVFPLESGLGLEQVGSWCWLVDLFLVKSCFCLKLFKGKSSHRNGSHVAKLYWWVSIGESPIPKLPLCAGKEENSKVNETITASINDNNTTDMDTGFTPCLSVTFVNKSRSVGVNDSALEYYVALEYAAVPCVNNITTTICEVRVYEQVSCNPDAQYYTIHRA